MTTTEQRLTELCETERTGGMPLAAEIEQLCRALWGCSVIDLEPIAD